MDEKNLIEFYGQDVPRQSTNADWYAHQIAIVNKRNAELEQHHQAQQERIDALESELAQAKREIDGLTQEIPKCGNPLHAACKCHGCTEIGTKPDCLTCEAEASLQSAQETLQWQEITPEHLPKVGDEVRRPALSKAVTKRHNPELLAVTESMLRIFTGDFLWHEQSWTHFRPINPPAPKEPQHGAE